MKRVVSCCAGLDVHKEHKESVEARVRRMDASGHLHQQTYPWGTMTADLLARADWFTDQGVRRVPVESTGGFWKADFQHLGGALHHVAGECAASEASSRPQE